MSTSGPAQGGDGPPTRIREADLFGRGSAAALEAATDYLLLGRVLRPRRRGRQIAADIEGGADTYAVVATIEPGPTITCRCDCPAQRPFCRHALALLLAWARDAESFAPLDLWEAALRLRSGPELAALLASLAQEGGDALAVLQQAAAGPDWSALPPGRCLEAWPAFAAAARAAGHWPEAALELGQRIAGPPGQGPRDAGAPAGLASRQLAWWLCCVLPDLPEPALGPWLAHLATRLEKAAMGADAPALPPELGVWLARLAAALPSQGPAQGLWLARFAAACPPLGAVFEAEVSRLLWKGEVRVRLAGGGSPAEAGARAPASVQRCRQVLIALEEERRALAGPRTREPGPAADLAQPG